MKSVTFVFSWVTLQAVLDGRRPMKELKPYPVGQLLTAGFIIALTSMSGASVLGQSSADSVEAHVAAARAAAGQEHTAVFNSLCAAPAPPPAPVPQQAQQPAAPRPAPAGPPPRSQWHAAPAKVFDNLYYLGQTE